MTTSGWATPIATSGLAVTPAEFDVLWEWLGLGSAPVVLQLPWRPTDPDARRPAVNAAWQGLRARGLADASGPNPEIIRLMHLLAAPNEQVELRHWAEMQTRVLAGRRGEHTALAARQGDAVVLSTALTPNRGVLAALPPAPPGTGRSVTLPDADLTAAYAGVAGGCPVYEGLMDRGVDAADAELVESILGAEHSRAQVATMVADSWGVLRRPPGYLTILDTRYGRYLLRRDPAGDGTDWITLSPIDPRRTLHRLDELLAEATAFADRF